MKIYKILKEAVRIDGGELFVSKQDSEKAKTISVQGGENYLSIDIRIGRLDEWGPAYLIISGGFEPLDGVPLEFLSQLMKHGEITFNSISYSEGRNPMLDMLGKAMDTRYTENPDIAKSIPILYAVEYDEGMSSYQKGWTVAGIYQNKQKAEAYYKQILNNRIKYQLDLGYLNAKARVKVVTKKDRVMWLKKLHDRNILLETDISYEDRELMLNSESEIMPKNVKVGVAPIFGVLGPIKNDPSMAINRIIEISKEIAIPMLNSGKLDFLNCSNTFGVSTPLIHMESQQFQKSKDDYKITLKTQLESILYVSEIALKNYPKCKTYLDQQIRDFYVQNTQLPLKEKEKEKESLKPVKGDISNLLQDPDIKYWIDNQELGMLIKATFSMNEEILSQLEKLNMPIETEYLREYDEESKNRWQKIDNLKDKQGFNTFKIYKIARDGNIIYCCGK